MGSTLRRSHTHPALLYLMAAVLVYANICSDSGWDRTPPAFLRDWILSLPPLQIQIAAWFILEHPRTWVTSQAALAGLYAFLPHRSRDAIQKATRHLAARGLLQKKLTGRLREYRLDESWRARR